MPLLTDKVRRKFRYKRASEKRKDDRRDEFQRDNAGFLQFLKRSSTMDYFAEPNLLSQVAGSDHAESLLRGVKLDGTHPSGSPAPDKPESN
jgi:hypothetical protein